MCALKSYAEASREAGVTNADNGEDAEGGETGEENEEGGRVLRYVAYSLV